MTLEEIPVPSPYTGTSDIMRGTKLYYQYQQIPINILDVLLHAPGKYLILT